MTAPTWLADTTVRRSLWNENAASPHFRGHVPPVPEEAGMWLDTHIGSAQVWIVPAGFLPGVRQLAGLPVRHAAGLALPYLAHPMFRFDRAQFIRERDQTPREVAPRG